MMRKFEELSMNAWPGFNVSFYDGWVMRSAQGYTKRANSVIPIYDSTEDLPTKVQQVEKFYQSKGLPAIFKLTNTPSHSELEKYLKSLGYSFQGETSVQILQIDDNFVFDTTDLSIYNTLEEIWKDKFVSLNNVPENSRELMANLLKRIPCQTSYVSLEKSGKTIGCALGILEGTNFGLFNIVIDSKLRGKGFGKELVTKLVGIGKKLGAKTAYLQVELKNAPAINLYKTIGFKEEYQYWYRVKNLEG